MRSKSYSYELERQYYASKWPTEDLPYGHLEPYVTCWFDPAEVFAGRRVLDIGAGGCTYTRMIAERFHPKYIVACELFHERMAPAMSANRDETVHFVSGDCYRLPVKDDSFDVVFGSLILHQLPDLTAVVKEVQRVLCRGGVYVGIEPNPYNLVHLFRYFRGRHSGNQYLLMPNDLRPFHQEGFAVNVRFFYAKWPWVSNPIMGTCMGVTATLRSYSSSTDE